MVEKLLKCPNCGANATNHQNCEYCGSLLVRFVDKSIDLSNTSYTSNAEVFPGLIQHLQQNLRMQSNNSSVATDIFREIGKQQENTNGIVLSVLQTGRCTWSDGQDVRIVEGNKGLYVGLNFLTVLENDSEEAIRFNQTTEEVLSRFEKLDCFPLFTPHMSYGKSFGEKTKIREYAIDFGLDVEGAARLISDIMQKVYQIPLTERIEIFTNNGKINIDKARKEACKARGADFDGGIPQWVWWVAGIILFALIQMCS